MSTTHPYVPMIGSGIDYVTRNITGLWHPENGFLDVVSRVDTPNERISWSTLNTNFGNLEVSYRHLQTEPDFPIDWSSALKDSMFVLPSGKHCFGEIGNWQGMYTTPGICKITLNPIVGEIIDQTITIFLDENTANIYGTMRYIYRTLAHLTNYGALGTGDYWRTSLYEVEGQMVYNYVYLLDVGLVAFWWGKLGANNTVIGKEKRMII